MNWIWRKVINLGGGARANLSRSGVGWSWGIPFLRFGKSASGTTWISVGIPGTGLYFTKRLRSDPAPPTQTTRELGTPDDRRSSRGGIKKWRDIR